MALDSVKAFMEFVVSFDVGATVTGIVNGLRAASQPKKRFTFTVGAGALQVSALYYSVVTLTASANTSIDLSSFTDALQRSGQSMTELKGVLFWLLNATDEAPDGTTGTAATGIVIGNGTNPQGMFLTSNTATITLLTGEVIAWATPSAAGKTVDSSNKTIKLLNSDGAVSAKILVALLGD